MQDSRPFHFLKAKADAGIAGALACVIGVEGGGFRAPGAMIAASADGDHVGSLSGGCIEAAISAEAREAIAEGRPRIVRYGAGSPFIDIRLPCGGAVEVLISPVDGDIVHRADMLFSARTPTILTIPLDGAPPFMAPGEAARTIEYADRSIGIAQIPPPRLLVLGAGEATEALVRHCDAARLPVHLYTPDPALTTYMLAQGRAVTRLTLAHAPPELDADRWTAAAFLFHEHAWEGPLLAKALTSPAFYVGAMGSRATHRTRLDTLEAIGISAADRARIHAPIGIVPGARDPATLAVSVLGEILENYSTMTVPDVGNRLGVSARVSLPSLDDDIGSR